MTYGFPIRGPLHPIDWVRPAGNQEMRVTQTAAQHHAKLSATTHLPAPMALDIGDGNPDHDDIIAPHAGVVAGALTVGSANLYIDWTEGTVKWRAVLAHMVLPHIVRVGQTITLGQLVGHMGSTSVPSMPVALHLHIQIGYLSGTTWVWLDPWPLLNNEGQENEVISAPIIARIVNRQCTGHAGVKFRADPSTTNPELLIVPLGTVLQPDFSVTGALVAGTATWYTAMFSVNGKLTRGYFHESTVTPLVPVEQSGHSDADLAAAQKAAAATVANAAATQANTFP